MKMYDTDVVAQSVTYIHIQYQYNQIQYISCVTLHSFLRASAAIVTVSVPPH